MKNFEIISNIHAILSGSNSNQKIPESVGEKGRWPRSGGLLFTIREPLSHGNNKEESKMNPTIEHWLWQYVSKIHLKRTTGKSFCIYENRAPTVGKKL